MNGDTITNEENIPNFSLLQPIIILRNGGVFQEGGTVILGPEDTDTEVYEDLLDRDLLGIVEIPS